MEVRLAKDEEGLEIKALFNNRDKLADLDWQTVFPYWAIVVDDGEVIAALQMCMSRPIGRLECLLTKEGTNPITLMRASKMIMAFGEAAMKANGCSMIAGYVTFKNKPIKKLIKKHYGAVVVDSGSMLMWRIGA